MVMFEKCAKPTAEILLHFANFDFHFTLPSTITYGERGKYRRIIGIFRCYIMISFPGN